MSGRLAAMPRVVQAVALALVVAHLARLVLSEDQTAQLFDALAVIPVRYAAESQFAFTKPMDALFPLVGHVFLHGGLSGVLTIGLLHLFFNVMVFLQAAPLVAMRLDETGLGPLKFLAVFFVAAAAGALVFIGLHVSGDLAGEAANQAPHAAVGASGAVCGLFAAYLLAARSDWRSAFGDPAIRQAAVGFVGVNVVLVGLLAVTMGLPIAWEAHLGGFIGGGIAYALLAPRPAQLRLWR